MHHCWNLILLSLIYLLPCRAVTFPHPTPNGLNFLGIGYNIIDGNPEGGDLITGGVDPGLLVTRRIMDFTYNESKRSTDLRYSIPDQSYFVTRSSAFTTTTYTTFHGTNSYTKKLLTQVKSSVGLDLDIFDFFLGMEFSASSRYEQIKKKTTTFGYIYFANETVRNLGRARYQMELAGEKSYPLAKGFVADACRLSKSYDKNSYMSFLDKWGTHIVTAVDLGIRSGEHYQSNRSSFLNYVFSQQDTSLDFKLNLDLVFRSSLSIDMSLFNTGMTAETFFGSKSSSYTIGSDELHEPIGLILTPINEVFYSDYWKLMTSYVTSGLCSSSWNATLSAVEKNMETALQNYTIWRKKFPLIDPLVVVPVTWPVGTYALPKSLSGCPNHQFAWAEGWRFEDTNDEKPDNTWSNPLHLSGLHQKNNMREEFCVKTSAQVGDYQWSWPPGTYCIYQYSSQCPPDFKSGFVLRDDENKNNNNSRAGAVPFGVYNIDTKIFFCCREDGPTDFAMYMPTDDAFFLFNRFGECQKIAGMKYTLEWFDWDTEVATNKDNASDPYPYQGLIPPHSVKLYFCYYEQHATTPEA